MAVRYLTEREVQQARDRGEALTLEAGDQLTPAAKDAARLYDVVVVPGSARHRHDFHPGPGQILHVAVAADHGGVAMKTELVAWLRAQGHAVADHGAHSDAAVDYPDFALAAAAAVAAGDAHCGIVLDGAGIGSCMAANKVPGVLAANCHTVAAARNSREHNNANVLTLGAKMIDWNTVREVVEAWLATRYAGGRHQRRVDKLLAIEIRHLRPNAARL